MITNHRDRVVSAPVERGLRFFAFEIRGEKSRDTTRRPRRRGRGRGAGRAGPAQSRHGRARSQEDRGRRPGAAPPGCGQCTGPRGAGGAEAGAEAGAPARRAGPGPAPGAGEMTGEFYRRVVRPGQSTHSHTRTCRGNEGPRAGARTPHSTSSSHAHDTRSGQTRVDTRTPRGNRI